MSRPWFLFNSQRGSDGRACCRRAHADEKGGSVLRMLRAYLAFGTGNSSAGDGDGVGADGQLLMRRSLRQRGDGGGVADSPSLSNAPAALQPTASATPQPADAAPSLNAAAASLDAATPTLNAAALPLAATVPPAAVTVPPAAVMVPPAAATMP
eukprot:292942-Chlamydomonas_euryale.AAC.1